MGEILDFSKSFSKFHWTSKAISRTIELATQGQKRCMTLLYCFEEVNSSMSKRWSAHGDRKGWLDEQMSPFELRVSKDTFNQETCAKKNKEIYWLKILPLQWRQKISILSRRVERRFLYFNHLSKEVLEQMIPHLKALI